MSTYFEIEVDGEVSVGERGTRGEKAYEVIELVNKTANLNFEISDNENDDLTSFELSVYHLENDETHRAFHSDLKANLDRDSLKQLRDYLSFLLGT